jgi:hypothetical protein
MVVASREIAMASAIGLRFYKATAHQRHQRGSEPCDPSELRVPVHDFLRAFVESHGEAVDDEETERSWYFEEYESDSDSSIRGHIHYGTFGFESTLRGAKTKKVSYERKINDVEEVPLFFEFWQTPEVTRHIFSFQSFQGRSCVSLVLQSMSKAFEIANPDYILRFRKLIATDSPHSLYANAPVKKLTFLKTKVFSDRFSAYSQNGEVKAVNFEMSYKAQRGGILGVLGDITNDFAPNDAGVVVVDGREFDEAIASVLVGKKTRPVGIFGPTSDTGAIDVTESVVKGANGHPTFDSIAEQSDLIMIDLNERIGDEP